MQTQRHDQLIFSSETTPEIIQRQSQNFSDHDHLPDTHLAQGEQHTDKLHRLITRSEHILAKISSVFPFEFFPDTIIIDETKVNIIHRVFFFSEDILSILIHNIADVTVETSILFATLKILPVGFGEHWISVGYLKKRQAIRAKDIIAGLMVGVKEGLDLSKVQTDHVVQKIQAVGAAM